MSGIIATIPSDAIRPFILSEGLIDFWEDFREFAYPDPYSPLAKATRGKDWGHQPAQAILENLPAHIASLSGDPWTVGKGTTGRDVGPGSRMSRAEATERSRRHLRHFQLGVRRQLKRYAKPWEEAAMISFAYNVGLDEDTDTKAEGFGDSTLLRLFNAGDLEGAARQFFDPKTGDSPWDNAGGVRDIAGLRRRRSAERDMFLGTHPLIARIT